MTERELGYVELEWRCPSCGTRNPGSAKKCRQCGAALTEEIRFEQAPQEELITDEARLAQARAGPDIQCAYCGTANPATAKTCKQCGADLAEGKARQAGQVLGAFRAEPAAPLKCPACGKENPATALKCAACGAALAQPVAPAAAPAPAKAKFPTGILVAVLLGLCLLGGLLFALSTRTTDTIGQVNGVSWRRAIAVEALAPVTRQAWRDEIPAGATVGQCTRKVHHTQPNPAPDAKEVCGTPYTVDQGSGYGKVVQQCWYEVYADWCDYQALEWRVINTVVAQGADPNPIWPEVRLAEGQRAGARQESYQVNFLANDKTYTFSPADAAEFSRFQPGTRWKLKINTFGAVTGVEPAAGP